MFLCALNSQCVFVVYRSLASSLSLRADVHAYVFGSQCIYTYKYVSVSVFFRLAMQWMIRKHVCANAIYLQREQTEHTCQSPLIMEFRYR